MMDGNDKSELFYQFEMARTGEQEKPVLRLDTERYAHHLKGLGLTDEQEREALVEVWKLIVTFVELGFGVHPFQQACGQVEKTLDLQGQTDSDEVESEGSGLKGKFDNTPE